MLKRALVIVAALCGCAGAGQTITVNDVQLDVKRKLDIAPPVTFRDLAVYECRASGTNEPVLVVTGQMATQLKDHLYTVRLSFDLWLSMPTANASTGLAATTTVANPPPKKFVRFLAVVPLSGYNGVPSGTIGVTPTYSLERTSATPALTEKRN